MERFNSLVNEKSIYLKGHSTHPVNWIAWSKYNPAYNSEKKPLFISIGYSSCHWCHVMAKESFADEAVAEYLNSNFISIKVDKEEYPDIDKKYQLFAQMTGKQGGWPLSIFADHERNPFFAGTYFPLEDNFGLPGFLSLLIYINNLYRNEPDKVTLIYKQYRDFLTIFYKKADIQVSDNSLDEFKKILDMDAGGFKGVQKFPNIPAMNYLLSFAKDDMDIFEFLKKTADSLCLSGIFDHIEGGFFRYTVDNRWNIPHFEKMLYDNGLNLGFLSKMYVLTEDMLYYFKAKKTADFMLKEFSTPYGFGSSFNADSENYGGVDEEGFYYKIDDRLMTDLKPAEAELITTYTYFNEGHMRLTEKIDYGKMEKLETVFQKLLEKRRQIKKTPVFDNKVIFSWNMIALLGLLDFYNASKDDYYFKKVLDIYFSLYDSMVKDGYIYRISYVGDLFDHRVLEDYAFFMEITEKLFTITGDRSFLDILKDMVRMVLELFEKDGIVYYDRSKEYIDLFDEAVPSSLGTFAQVMGKLKNILKYDKIDLESLGDYLRYFYKKYPIATPMVGCFLKYIL